MLKSKFKDPKAPATNGIEKAYFFSMLHPLFKSHKLILIFAEYPIYTKHCAGQKLVPIILGEKSSKHLTIRNSQFSFVSFQYLVFLFVYMCVQKMYVYVKYIYVFSSNFIVWELKMADFHVSFNKVLIRLQVWSVLDIAV